jgi:hypothetical protein
MCNDEKRLRVPLHLYDDGLQSGNHIEVAFASWVSVCMWLYTEIKYGLGVLVDNESD